MEFVIAFVAFLGVLAALMWFTGWAEQEVVLEHDPVEAKTR
jgi:hypothetical protein